MTAVVWWSRTGPMTTDERVTETFGNDSQVFADVR